MTPEVSFTGLAINRRETLFEKVAAEVEKQIQDQQWKVGGLLPNEVELAGIFGVSQGTIRRALKILVDKGVLIRQQGRGTFVADYTATSTAVAGRYVQLVPDANEPVLPSETVIETFETVSAAVLPMKVFQALALNERDAVLHVRRTHMILREGQRVPVSFDEHFLPAAIFQKLTRENMQKHREKVLYAFYQNVCGVTISNYQEEVKAAFLEDEYALRYGIATPEPILIGRRTAFTLGQKPVEYRIQRYMTRHYHFLVHS